MEQFLPHELQEECKHHYLARLSLKDSILLFIYNRVYHPRCKKHCNWNKRSELMRLYNEGQERIDVLSLASPNIHFEACGNTLAGVTKKEGATPPLIEASSSE